MPIHCKICGEQHPNHGKEHPRRHAKSDIGVDGGTHLFHLTGTEKPGNHHARAHRNTAEEPHQQKDECAGAGNGCQRAVAQQVADDEGIGGIIQLLEQKAQKQRDRKGYQLFGNGTFCHSYLGFGHGAGTPFFLPFSPLWGKLTVV